MNLEKTLNALNIAKFGKIEFLYEELETYPVDTHEYCDVYLNVTITKSNNSKYNIGQKIEQIAISHAIDFYDNIDKSSCENVINF